MAGVIEEPTEAKDPRMISVPDSATVDSVIEVNVTGSSRTNQTITVNINNGEAGTDTIDVNIDGNGNGSANWTVPDWDLANFEDGHCENVVCGIESPDAG